jgi:hypothetical protein
VQKYPSWRDESTKGTQQPAADPRKQSNYDVNVNVNVAAELNEKRERESPISGLIAPSSARRERGSKDESISNHDVPLSQRLLLFYPSHQPCWRSLRHCVGFKLQPAFDGPWPSAHIAIEFVKQYTLHRYLACHAPYARCYPITPNKAFHYGP